MSEKTKKVQKTSTSDKSLLEILRKTAPLNVRPLLTKIDYTLGECVLIFYEIEPIVSLANIIDIHIYNMIFNDNPPSKALTKKWIENIFPSNEIIHQVLELVSPKKRTLQEFINKIDEKNICIKLIERWNKYNLMHYELSNLLVRKELSCHGEYEGVYDDGKLVCDYVFSGVAFTKIGDEERYLFFPTLIRKGFGYLLKLLRIDPPLFFETQELGANIFPNFFWSGFRKVKLDSVFFEKTDADKTKTHIKRNVRSSFAETVRHATYAIYITRKNSGLTTTKEAVLVHPFMQKILRSIREHTIIQEDELEDDDLPDEENILDYRFPKNQRTIPEEWIDSELKKLSNCGN